MSPSRLSAAFRALKPFRKQDQAELKKQGRAELKKGYQNLENVRQYDHADHALTKVSGVKSGEQQHIFGLEIVPNKSSSSAASQTTARDRKEQKHEPAYEGSYRRSLMEEVPIEVLQQILSHLDLLTLLRCRCVNRLWNGCIPGDSPELREAMFLPTTAISEASEWPPLTLFFEIYTDADMTSHSSIQPRVRISSVNQVALSHVSKSSVAINPFIYNIDQYLVPQVPQLQDPESRYRASDDFHFTFLKNKKGDRTPYEDLDFISSMLVSMRPVTELHIHFRYMDCFCNEIGTRQNTAHCILSDKAGVKLVNIFRAIEMQVTGLLRDETLRQIARLPKPTRESKDLREELLYTQCPIKGRMQFLRC
ncbi:hypothetical protein EK21DRAFT_119170 [Setomelanomma holmii]|uniref:F-box domain-containing protein n=1 Tax=Setomelanomma holmii TaxID=210430 RepID=A0A9P4GW04_9PLEO|nr:hypothetical protein EK21DRAFT_119170 [Setomelanomma holmii]